jgi:MFS superfamily sulfate permease-like transporter
MPARLLGLDATNVAAAELAFVIGTLTILSMIVWEKVRPASMKLVPGALIGVLMGTIAAWVLDLPIVRVDVPSSIVAAIDAPGSTFLGTMMQPAILITAIAIAFIASAETLLSAAAVDRMHNGVRTDYDKELRAQGVGNFLCGLAGALPMTGVIVRSSANVQAGAMTRLSAILHGGWLLAFVALLPWLLREIPMAALAGILVVTGWRLVSVSHVRHLFHHHGPLPVMIWLATFVMVVATDLLTGVLVGLGLSLIELVPHLRRLRLDVHQRHEEEQSEIRLEGAATFVTLPKLLKALESIPGHCRKIRLDLRRVPAIDHSSAEMLAEWIRRRRSGGALVNLDGEAPSLRRMAA